jgi:hypothetical protein
MLLNVKRPTNIKLSNAKEDNELCLATNLITFKIKFSTYNFNTDSFSYKERCWKCNLRRKKKGLLKFKIKAPRKCRLCKKIQGN